jgi:acyl carrier protein
MKEFKEKLLDILEVDELNDTDILADFDEWDSLTILTLIATVDSDFGFQMDTSDLDDIVTINDLCNFINLKIN